MSIEAKTPYITDKTEENFINLEDGRLTREEIKEVVKLSSSLDLNKLKVNLETASDFRDFINTEYRWANESYLGGVKGVRKLQSYLIDKGFLDNTKINGKFKELDGLFGKNTFFALLAFQKSLDGELVIDGLAGPQTQARLFNSVNDKSVNSEPIVVDEKEKKTSKINSSMSEVTPTNTSISSILSDFYRKDFVGNDTNIYGFDNNFISYEAEKKGGMTYCSRTARLNLYKLGVPSSEVPRGASAIESMDLYSRKNYFQYLYSLPKGTNVLDLYVDTKSPYEHRAAAYLSSSDGWMVLDPYYRNGTKAIPMDDYLSNKKLIGAFPYSVKNVA